MRHRRPRHDRGKPDTTLISIDGAGAWKIFDMIKVIVVLAPDAAMRLAGASRTDVAEARRRTVALARYWARDLRSDIHISYADGPPPDVKTGSSIRIPVVFRGIGTAELRVVGDVFDPAKGKFRRS